MKVPGAKTCWRKRSSKGMASMGGDEQDEEERDPTAIRMLSCRNKMKILSYIYNKNNDVVFQSGITRISYTSGHNGEKYCIHGGSVLSSSHGKNCRGGWRGAGRESARAWNFSSASIATPSFRSFCAGRKTSENNSDSRKHFRNVDPRRWSGAYFATSTPNKEGNVSW